MADLDDRIEVTINKKKYQFAHAVRTGAQILQKAGFDADHYDLFQVKHGESVAVAADQEVTLKDGDRFRAVPKDITLG